MFSMKKLQQEKLLQAVTEVADETTAKAVVYGKSGQQVEESDADWVKNSMSRLEDTFEAGKVKQIRMKCQCGFGMEEKLQLVRNLMKHASCMEELADQDAAKAAGLSCVDGELYLQFPFCPCPMMKEVDRVKTSAWCQCTTGYSKVLFEKAFGCSVDVQLLKSIKMGDDICLMKIVPDRDIFA